MNPVSMVTGAVVVTSVFVGSVWAGENKAIIKNFKKENPTLFVFLVMVVSYFLMSLFGGVMVFLLGIKLPLLCKFLKKCIITIDLLLAKMKGSFQKFSFDGNSMECVRRS